MSGKKFKNEIYLDHAGAGKFTESQIELVFEDLRTLSFGNPHSRNPSSRITTDIVDQVRFRVLKHFNTSQDEYTVIFTSGATAALKIVGECFDFSASSFPIANPTDFQFPSLREPLLTPCFTYLTDNHTSVIGMRELMDKMSIKIYGCRAEQVKERLNSNFPQQNGGYAKIGTRNLFVFPGESNFSGRKYPLEWIEAIQDGWLGGGQWLVCLDAACLAATNPIDLSKFKPDFVALSFYKMFGYPTGLGALLVRNSSSYTLNKRYFGGGTVQVNLGAQDFHKKRQDLTEMFEDGTIDYLGIAALRHGFDAINEAGGINGISANVFSLSQFTVNAMRGMKHGVGSPVAVFYSDPSNFSDSEKQGGIVNFNLLKPDGTYVGFTEVEKMAELYNISLRTGCFCNQGACQEHLNISDEQLKQNFQEGKVCGDEIDLIDGRPVGSVRISFGFTSRKSDALGFLGMLFDCFVVEPNYKWQEFLASIGEVSVDSDSMIEKPIRVQNGPKSMDCFPAQEANLHLTDIMLFPIKSTRPIFPKSWEISKTGLAFDRLWMIANKSGVCLTQKQCPKLCTIQPNVSLQSGTLTLGAEGCDSHLAVGTTNGIGLENEVAEIGQCEAKICMDRVSMVDCGNDIGMWLDGVLEISGCRLLRQTDKIQRTAKQYQGQPVSLANVAQFLLLHRPSIGYLHSVVSQSVSHITEDDLVQRFRGNLVIDGGKPFEEDTWTRVTIGNVNFKVVGKCHRCQMICIDQNTGEKDPNILTSLRDIREGTMTFGVYLEAETEGSGAKLTVGDRVVVKN